jgi:hypothetical protein
MSLPKTQQFDMMIPFFGLRNDNRIRLYLHALQGEWRKSGKIEFTNTDGNPTRYELHAENFSVPSSDGHTGRQPHSEWVDFAANLLCRIRGSLPNETDSEVLSVIKTVGQQVLSSLGDETIRFLVAVIKAHSIIKDVSGKNITDLPREWTDASTVTRVDVTDIFRILPKLEAVGSCPDNPPVGLRNFSFKITKYIAQLMIEESAAPTSAPSPDTFWGATEPRSIEDVYYRKHPDMDKLYTVDASGKEVQVNSKETIHKVMTTSADTCNAVGANNIDGLKCNDYLLGCIQSGSRPNIKACKEYMLSKTFWGDIKDEVNTMLPTIIVNTLDSFGFTVVTNDAGLDMYCSVNEWLKNLKTHIKDDGEYSNISSNTKLIAYLDLLVAKINSNPSILNKSYYSTPQQSVASQMARFNGTYLSKIGVKPVLNFVNNNNVSLSPLVGFLNTVKATRSGSYMITMSPTGGVLANGAPFIIGGLPTFLPLRGGRPLLATNAPVQQCSELIGNTFMQLDNALKARGKQLDQNTREQFLKLLESYKSSEVKLWKAIKYADAYANTIDLFKQYDKNNILTIDGMKKFVEERSKYENKLDNKENSVVNILQLLVELIDEKLGTSTSAPRYNSSRV